MSHQYNASDFNLIEHEFLNASNHKKIAKVTLNNPKTLNAQNYEMVRHMADLLATWANDEQVAMVLLCGSGDKALCAGGDIKSLWAGDKEYAKDFFDHEYGLMHTMHTYAKPILTWGNGIVMGGGLGLLASSSHKVVTESTVMAMPEVSIGLFPDAGASYFLNHMMGKIGLFLGLTGARFSGEDALYLNLADALCLHADFERVINALINTHWQDDQNNHHLLSQVLSKFHQITPAVNRTNNQILTNFDEINRLMNATDLLAVDEALQGYAGDSEFIKSAITTYKEGSAITKALTWRIYHDLKTVHKDYSLAQIFAMESLVATHCVMRGDFKEGVRALLIDKDKQPQWRYGLEQIDKSYLDGYFVP